MPNWWSKRYRTPIDFRYLWFGKGRKGYIEAFKKLGFNDICLCTDEGVALIEHKVLRMDSGDTGQLECSYCGMLLFPFQHLYECDDCTEPTLSDKYPLPVKDSFYCENCK